MLLLVTVNLFVDESKISANAQAQTRPNILILTADDMNFDSVGVYGCPVEESTPNIDRLASQGIQFDYGYVNIAICHPSRQVMLTGSHSHQTFTRSFTPVTRVGLALPDVLKQSGGYYLAQVNKRQVRYDWDTDLDEKASDWGRNVQLQGELAGAKAATSHEVGGLHVPQAQADSNPATAPRKAEMLRASLANKRTATQASRDELEAPRQALPRRWRKKAPVVRCWRLGYRSSCV